MQIKLKIDNKEVTFKQEKVTFQTMMKALDYQNRLLDQFKALEHLASVGIDEEVEEIEQDPKEDAEKATDLIVSYFDGQFTHDDFVSGAYFGSIRELYDMAEEVMYEILTAKEEKETLKKTKRQPKK